MERKEATLKTGCSKILWVVLAILLPAAPCVALDVTGTLDVDSSNSPIDIVNVKADGTLNVWPGGYIVYGVVAEPDSVVNIYGGTIGDGQSYGITALDIPPLAVVTVYGTVFQVNNGDDIVPPDTVTIPFLGVLSGDFGDDLMFMSFIPIFLKAPVTKVKSVDIDIKPGSYPNAINLGSNGVIPVAILSSPDFDATTVLPDTVTLAGSGVAVRGKGNKLLSSEEDVNGDGLMDLVLKVETENLDEDQFQDGYAILTGQTSDGVTFEGSDSITIVPPEDPVP